MRREDLARQALLAAPHTRAQEELLRELGCEWRRWWWCVCVCVCVCVYVRACTSEDCGDLPAFIANTRLQPPLPNFPPLSPLPDALTVASPPPIPPSPPPHAVWEEMADLRRAAGDFPGAARVWLERGHHWPAAQMLLTHLQQRQPGQHIPADVWQMLTTATCALTR